MILFMVICMFIEKLIDLDPYYNSRNHSLFLFQFPNLNLNKVLGIIISALFKLPNLNLSV